MNRYQVWQQRPDSNDSVQLTDDYAEACTIAKALTRRDNPVFVVDTLTHETKVTFRS